MRKLLEHFCTRDDMSTYDPYDIWKTRLGFRIKNYYNCHRKSGLIAAAPLAVFDHFINNRARLFCQRQEYPVVRALAAQTLMNLYQRDPQSSYLKYINCHLRWLTENSCEGYSGSCWGLHFNYAVGCDLVYDVNTPFSTMTPYPLEAFIQYTDLTGDKQYVDTIESISRFFRFDIQTMEETDNGLATSYTPMRDRIVINAVSYTMYALCLLLPYIPVSERPEIEARIRKLYSYIRNQQRSDGSWLYSPDGKSFIDCFHTCIVIKNLVKANRIIGLDDSDSIVENGYQYLRKAFLDEKYWLFRRFSLSNKPSIIKFDLYDNAEALNLALLLGDGGLARRLTESVSRYFRKGNDIYSQLDILNVRKNRNMLRWAVMPYLYALSKTI